MKTTYTFYKEEGLRITNQKVFETTCETPKTAKRRLNEVHDGSFPIVMVTTQNGMRIGKESIYYGLFL